MANVTLEVATQVRFFITGSFSPADAATNLTIGTPTDVVLTQSALADGAGRQSDKFDFGANRAERYELSAAVDFTGETPTLGERVEYYFAPSTITTQGSGNVAGNSGADAAAPGGALGTILIAEFLKQCQYIGSLIVHDGAVVQNQVGIGVLVPTSRFGQLVVMNQSGDAFEADDVENHVVLTPMQGDVSLT